MMNHLKKIFVGIVVSITLCPHVNAQQITAEQARLKAYTFWNKLTGRGKRLQTPSLSRLAPYYVFNDDEKGFVIIAGDASAQTILGYSTDGTFQENNMPPGLKDLLNNYSQQITDLQATNHTPGSYSATNASTGEVKLNTAQWNQQGQYAKYTPNHAPTGCVATATAIIMRYFEWPEKGVSQNRYYSTYTNGFLEADFSKSTYEWNYMPYRWTELNQDGFDNIARLMADIGVSIEIIYGDNESSASITSAAQALKTYFNYSMDIQFQEAASYSDTEWKNMLRNEIDNDRPVLYCGQNDITGKGHAFVVDGYKGNDMFSVNWGWGGSCNGFYALGQITEEPLAYSMDQACVMGIEPSTEEPLTLNLHMDKEGNLFDLLESQYSNKLIEKLTVSGNINDQDLIAARGNSYILLNADFSNAISTTGKVPDSYFHASPYLKSVILPQGITTIYPNAFANCDHLLDITIPPTVTTIGDETFSGCNTLKDLTVLCQTPPALGQFDVFYDVPLQSVVLHVPAGCRDSYVNAQNGWEQFANIQDDAKDVYTTVKTVSSQDTNLQKAIKVSGKHITAEQDILFDVYDPQGRMITSHSNSLTTESGIYIIKWKGQTLKVSIP